ncbi:Protein prenyltransferase alpha subunit repeat-containing protein 1 [Phytophthora citrophthora]|uniref:Protein prenyltransferase alpha subunit repeat-containing protein 1 n=1 Tax=Phytophthora citrophthora TaxID=4793 RepID=A0AAD9FZ11_9STRA|nr:Protein prenyltransferase alpha subunit repeat-containing protein 1 [Phytophthora citrophthora]
MLDCCAQSTSQSSDRIMTTGETLLALLSNLFQQDPLIDEVGLLFGTEASDLTPESAFFLEEHKLGVAFAAGIPLFQAARTQFHLLNALLQQEADEITKSEGNECRAQLLHCTRAILLISADFYTAWNTRKSFVARGWLDALDEVKFTNLVFTLHPKSIDTWAYRRWLAVRLCEELTGDDLRSFYKQQIEVCSRLAEQKPRNYHAWSFRHWIVSRLPLDLALKELEDMEQWCRTHVTDHSGWNHRQHTLNELAKKYQASEELELIRKQVLAEYKFVSDTMTPYPTHEALWCHRRYVVQCLFNQVAGTTITNDVAPVCELISQVAETRSSTQLKGIEAETLSSAWTDAFKTLSNGAIEWLSVLRVVLNEIDSAWKCGNQFSRRYAAWCLARLRVLLRNEDGKDQAETLARELSSLSSSLQQHLVQEDNVLEDLWLQL